MRVVATQISLKRNPLPVEYTILNIGNEMQCSLRVRSIDPIPE